MSFGVYELFANHVILEDGKARAAQDLKQVLLDFIESAEKSLVLNVFEFDLEDVAKALIRKAKVGVKIRIGMDKNMIAQRPGAKKVFDLLGAQTTNLTVHAVDSVCI